MIIRPYKVEDLDAIDAIYTKYYAGENSLPDLNHTVTNAVIQDGDRIIGFGLVKLWAEAVMVLDRGESRRVKTIAHDMLITHAIKACEHYKIDKLYASVGEPNFQRLLENKYSFKPMIDKVLYRETT